MIINWEKKMSKSNIVFNIVADQGYIRSDGKRDFSAENDILFSAISNTYVPLLNLFEVLRQDRIDFKIGVVLSPIVCALLNDPQVQTEYVEWLDRRINLGNSEISKFKKDDPLYKNAADCLNAAQKAKTDFVEVYQQKLLKKFKEYQELGFIELISTSATSAFLPHLSGMQEAINAQIEIGLMSQKQHFGSAGEGFYLPYNGYSEGLEYSLRPYGVNYTILDANAILFSDKVPSTGIFAPVRTLNSLVVFGSDSDVPACIIGDDGYAQHEVYKNVHRDIGFEYSIKELEPFAKNIERRVPTGYKYWNNSSDSQNFYDVEKALQQAKIHAQNFVQKKTALLDKAKKYMEQDDPVLVCNIPAELLGNKWAEGINWFEEVLRLLNDNQTVQTNVCGNLIQNQFSLPKISPYPCASNGTGYGEDFIDSKNDWMIRYIQKATARMIDLAERFPTDSGLKQRLLNLGAKEVLLCQSSAWPKMIKDGVYPQFAEEEFKKTVLAFSQVFDSLGCSTVSTEWLTTIEKEHSIFQWLNYRVFSPKK